MNIPRWFRLLQVLLLAGFVQPAFAVWMTLTYCQNDPDADGVGYGAVNTVDSTSCPYGTTQIGQCVIQYFGGSCPPAPAGETDNCPNVANVDQLDTNGDGTGNACDSDGDGIDNAADNCPAVANADQLDTDGDGTGNACDSTPNGDSDGDGIDNSTDNCPAVANANQLNSDGDLQGNVCDRSPLLAYDDDGDGVVNQQDAFPADAGGAADTDGDGRPDSYTYLLDGFESGVLEIQPFAWSTGGGANWTVQTSPKKEGAFAAKSPNINSWLQFTYSAPNPVTITFWSGAAIFGTTVSGKFYIDGVEKYSQTSSTWIARSFVVPAGIHTFKWVLDGCASACTGLPPSTAIDGVRLLDTALVEDADDDNDGVVDGSDAFSLNAAESADTDGDGTGNNADLDDDNDSVPDYIDADPLNAAVNTEVTLPVNGGYKGSVVTDRQNVQ